MDFTVRLPVEIAGGITRSRQRGSGGEAAGDSSISEMEGFTRLEFRMRKTPRFIVCVSDTHAGCQLALCPKEGAALDGGGTYKPSALQMKLWDMWEEFWRWVGGETRGEAWDLELNGDLIDGSHHGSVTQITHNITDQRKIAVSLLMPVVEKCRKRGGRLYVVRGTEAHVGQSGCEDEALAKELGAVPDSCGNYARMELRKDLDGSLIHFLHHVGTVSSNAYEASAVGKELAETFTEAGRWGTRPPDMIVRSHRHRYIQIHLPTKNGRGIAVVTPSWQLKTPFAYRIAGARVSTPQIGGIIIRKTDGYLHTVEKIWSVEPPETEY